MSFSIAEQIELGNFVRDLDQIFTICNEFVNKNPLQLSEQVTLATSIRDSAENVRDQLNTAIGQYRQLTSGPFPNQQAIFDLKRYISKLVLTDYRANIIPFFQQLTENILSKEDEINRIAEEKRTKGAPIPTKPDIDKGLAEARAQIISVKQDAATKETFTEISSFAAKARPYVEKIIKASKIALSIIGLFV